MIYKPIKIVCLILLVSLLPQLVFAQNLTPAQMEVAKKYLQPEDKTEQLKEKVEIKKATTELQKEKQKELLSSIEKEFNAEALRQIKEIERRLEQEDRDGDGIKILRQFGYDIFAETVSSFQPSLDMPVGSDYLVGPGDSFNVTMWGVSEGIFKVTVNSAGEITLPKVGVVRVAGLAFGEFQSLVEGQLSRFYKGVNVSITLESIKTIRVYVVGEVERPGSYSISSLSTLYTALFEAGGPSKDGSMRDIQLRRADRVMAHADLYEFLLNGDKNQDVELKSGDTIFVPMIGPVVGISGNVYRPAIYEIQGTADLVDLLRICGGVTPSGYLNRIQIERIVNHEKKIVADKNISQYSPWEKMGIPIKNRDSVKVYPIYAEVWNYVELKGFVKHPGRYELKDNMRLKDILTSVQDFLPSAYLNNIEIIRQNGNKTVSIISIDAEKLFLGDKSQNVGLMPLDQINVYSDVKSYGQVELSGEFKVPGTYSIEKGEKISSVIERAGGFTDDGYLFGAIFSRSNVKIVQNKAMTELIKKLELSLLRKGRDLISMGLDKETLSYKEAELSKATALVEGLRSQTLDGRVIINLSELSKFKNSEGDIELEDGDNLIIPKVPKTVVILGEVYSPKAVVYSNNYKVTDYLDKVGGLTENADRSAVYVIQADGSVLSQRRTPNLFSLKLNPGDAVLAPEVLEKFSLWASIKEFTRWLYDASLTVAIVAAIVKR